MTSALALQGKTAIVSGGARAIGEAIARRLANDGAQVVIGDVLDDLGKLVAESLGHRALYVHLDVTSPSDWSDAVSATRSTFDDPSILVSNAGILRSSPFEDTTPQDMRDTFEVNAMGAFFGIRAVLDPMRSRGGGSIVVVSSVAGTVGVEGLTAYCTSKAANAMIARCAAIELGEHNIRVNSVHPARVDTPMSTSGAVSDINPLIAQDLPPLGRVAECDDVAALVAFLVSDDSAYITGVQHHIDGGRLAGYKYSKPTGSSRAKRDG